MPVMIVSLIFLIEKYKDVEKYIKTNSTINKIKSLKINLENNEML